MKWTDTGLCKYITYTWQHNLDNFIQILLIRILEIFALYTLTPTTTKYIAISLYLYVMLFP
jgi:hypothetical protein